MNVTFLLYDPGWYVHKPDVQNKWENNTRTHTQTVDCANVNSIRNSLDYNLVKTVLPQNIILPHARVDNP